MNKSDAVFMVVIAAINLAAIYTIGYAVSENSTEHAINDYGKVRLNDTIYSCKVYTLPAEQDYIGENK